MIRIRPTWNTVENLTEHAHGDDTLNIERTTCLRCTEEIKNERQRLEREAEAEKQRLEREREKQKEAIRTHGQWLEGTRKKLEEALQAEPGRTYFPLMIRHDKYSSPLRRDTRELLNATARKLVEIGFRHSPADLPSSRYKLTAGRYTQTWIARK